MKNEDIKLHSNIMKIFKYLVFVISFSFIFFITGKTVNAVLYFCTDNGGYSEICYDNYYAYVDAREKGNYLGARSKYTTSYNDYQRLKTINFKIGEYDVVTFNHAFTKDSGGYLSQHILCIKNMSVGSECQTISYVPQGNSKWTKIEQYVNMHPQYNIYIKIYDNDSISKSSITYDTSTSPYTYVVSIKYSDFNYKEKVQQYYDEENEYYINGTYDATYWENSKIKTITTKEFYITTHNYSGYPTISYTSPSSAKKWRKSHEVTGISMKDEVAGIKSKQYCWSTSSTSCTSSWTTLTNASVSKSDGTGKYYLLLKVVNKAGEELIKVVSTSTVKCTTSAGSSSGGSSSIGGGKPSKDLTYVAALGTSCYTVEEYAEFWLDNTAPNKLEFVVDESEPNKKKASARSHTVKIVASDEHSGMSKISYCWGKRSGSCDLVSSQDYASVKSANEDLVKDQILLGEKYTGTAYLSVTAYDNVEEDEKNSTSSSIELIFDNTAPTVDFQESVNKTYIDDWHKKATLKILVKDRPSGILKIEYCFVEKASEDCSFDKELYAATETIDYAKEFTIPSPEESGRFYLKVKTYDRTYEGPNTETYTSDYQIKIDVDKPYLKPSFDITYDEKWAYNHTITFMLNDDDSGVSSAYYCFKKSNEDGSYNSSAACIGKSTIGSGKHTVSTEELESGRYYLYVYAIDSNIDIKNDFDTHTANVIKVDKTKPEIEFTKITYDGKWAYDHEITISVSDAHSGVSSASYCFKVSNKDGTYNSSATCIGNMKVVTNPVKTDQLGSEIYYLYVYAEDSNADKKNSHAAHTENVIKVDKTKPEIEFTKITYDGKWAYDHEITISVSDAHSGVSSASYCFKLSNKDGTYNSSAPCIGNMKTVANPVSTRELGSEIYYLYVYAEDSNADYKNKFYKHTENVIKVDKTKPTIGFTKITYNGLWAYDHEITISVSDAHSGISNAYYCFKKSNEDGTYNSSAPCIGNMKTVANPVSTKELESGKYYLYVYALDSNADKKNSYAVYTTNVIKVDKTSPVIEFSRITEDDKWAKDHNVVVKVSDAHSGLSEIQYKWCEIGVTKESCENDERAWYIVSKINNKYPNGDYEISSVDNADTKSKLDGGYYLLVKAVDDNVDIKNSNSENTKEIKFDNTAPILVDINKDELKNQVNNKLLVKASDVHTSVDSVQISWGTEIKDVKMSKDAEGNYVYEFPKEVEGTIKVTLTLIDILGNDDSNEYEVKVDTVSIIARDKDDNKLDTIPNLSIRKPSAKENKVTYEVEEMVEIEVEEDKEVVVVSEKVEEIEVNVEEENEEMDNKVIEIASTEVCVTSIKFSYANEELKKLFVLNKKLNNWFVSKK